MSALQLLATSLAHYFLYFALDFACLLNSGFARCFVNISDMLSTIDIQLYSTICGITGERVTTQTIWRMGWN